MPAAPAPERALTLIFSKRPHPGQVKTRLCPPLTQDQAAELALAMLDDTVERHLAAPEYRTEIVAAPASDVSWFQERYGAPVSGQVGSGLGERLAHGFDARCAPGQTTVVVGSDCPFLAPDGVAQAHRRLAAGADLVLAPDGGGGYSLVGLVRAVPALFTEVRMSTRSMLEETLLLARARGLGVELLKEYRDIDEPADLVRLDRELRDPTMQARSADPAFPVRTFQWLRRHAERT